MPLFLTHEEVEGLLTMEDTLQVLEKAYMDLGRGLAMTRPRSDMIISGYTDWPDAVYALKTMDGAVPESGYAAIRLNSDIVHWPEKEGKKHREKIAAMPGGKWMALILLFSVKTGEFLAMMPDGVLQRNRVGATNGLGVKYMARKDAAAYGLFGTGWQAGGQLMAVSSVRYLSLVKVYSRDPENRKKFADAWSKKLNLEIEPAATPLEVVKGSDIVGLATNTIEPIFRTGWLQEGMHVTCVKPPECEPEVYQRVDRLAVNFKQGYPQTYYLGEKKVAALEKAWSSGREIDLNFVPELSEIIGGREPGRNSQDEITCFLNNIGLGFQFASVAGKVYELARERGAGKELPLDWFTQPVHP